nr:putative capsid [Marmot picobirnavirus]
MIRRAEHHLCSSLARKELDIMNNNKPNGKNRKPQKRRPARNSNREGKPTEVERDVDRSYAMSSLNDISWYTRNPLLTEAAGRIPYPYKPGMTIPLDPSKQLGSTANPKYTVPAVMVLDWVPTVGKAAVSTDPINLVAREIYAKIRKAYSGELAVDPNDLIMYLMALDSVFIFLGWWKRVYRLISLYSSENMAMPHAFLNALNFQDDQIKELQQKKTQLWQAINELIYMSHQLTCPAIMDVFNRHYWMSDNIYTDANSVKAQMFMFNAHEVYQYVPDPEYGSELVLTPLSHRNANGDPQTVEHMFEDGLALIQALTSQEDSFIINGYLQRAYEGVPLFQVQPLLQDEYIVPVYVPEVLMQIENSQALPLEVYTRGTALFLENTVRQEPSTGDVLCAPSVRSSTGSYSVYEYMNVSILSSRSDMPSVAENVLMTRLKCKCTEEEDWTDPGSGTTEKVHPIICGTEIPIAWYVMVRDQTASYSSYIPVHVPKYMSVDFAARDDDMSIIEQREIFGSYIVSSFDWHPISWIFYDGGKTTQDFGSFTPLGDIHNTTILTEEELRNLHKVCIYSEFNAFSQP